MQTSASEFTALPLGTTVGPARVVEFLAADHQTAVYRAERVDRDEAVMLYEYLPAGLAQRGPGGVQAAAGKAEPFARGQAAFTTRLRAAALVGHPALPAIDDIWPEKGTVYALAAWRPGRSLLAELSTRRGGLDASTLGVWVRTLCDALSSLHQHELVHGNLSIAMVRVLDTGELLLPPVGHGVPAEDPPGWSAPEQHPASPKPGPVGPWTDVYQLSAVLLQLMTGRPPPPLARRWQGETPFERLGELAGRFPEQLVLTVKRGLSMQAAARPQDTRQWLAEAGLPDRREFARYDPHEPAPSPLSETGREAGATSRPADLGDAPFRTSSPVPLAPNSGHMPLRQTVEERLERAETQVPRGTPGWVWGAVVMAVAALAGIVLLA